MPCIFSTDITKEISLSDKAKFLALDSGIDEWVNSFKVGIRNTERRDNSELLRSKNYDIKIEAIKLQNKYLEMA